MPSSRGLASTGVAQLLIRGCHGGSPGVDEVVRGDVFVEGGYCRDDDIAGDVTRGHPAHAVGDCQEARTGIHRILIAFPEIRPRSLRAA